MTAKRKARQKKITLSEFRLWLRGVQSMQADDWCPNKDQWKMILDQIENIKETEVVKEVEQPAQHLNQNLVPRGHPHNPQQGHRQLPPIPMPSGDGTLPMPALIPTPEDIVPMPPAGSSPHPTAGDSGLQTPTIQSTEDGSYKSSFS